MPSPLAPLTGAGDAFAGGFAVALAENQGVEAATRFGCAVAAISVTRAGTAPAMPYRKEVDELLKKALFKGAVAQSFA
jgi:ribokinase